MGARQAAEKVLDFKAFAYGLHRMRNPLGSKGTGFTGCAKTLFCIRARL
jgi:hypothetical protein